MDKEVSKHDGDKTKQESVFKDPAILTLVPCAVTFRYSKEELLKLRKAPTSQRRPDYLDSACYNQQGVWDPWLYSNKQTEASPAAESTVEASEPSGKARSRPSDPRERIRKEQDGIILSPQRRSFNSGCFVPLRDSKVASCATPTLPIRTNRAHSPLGSAAASGGKGEHSMSRRIGSGRILGLDDFAYRRDEERFDRRSFGKEFESTRRTSNQRGYSRRMNEAREEEPEWFSSGPMSQNDTIELRGFDDVAEKPGKKEKAGKRALAASKERKNVKEANGSSGGDEGKSSVMTEEVVEKVGDAQEEVFNFDAMLKDEAFSGLLSNGVEAGDAAGSRFSRWFQREQSPPAKEASRKSSLQDPDQNFIKLLLNEAATEERSGPGASEAYFAPISPAPGQFAARRNFNLMEMLQGSKGKEQAEQMGAHLGSGKILSVEELEGKMRQGGGGVEKPVVKSSEEEVNAFKRLFSQMNVSSGGTSGQQTKPMSILEMLNHSQQKDADAARYALMLHQNAADVSFKLQQVHNQTQQATLQQKQQQFEIIAKLINAGTFQSGGGGGGGSAGGAGNGAHASAASPMAEVASLELLNRPEAQAIQQGLKRGDITPQHLYQQLSNPAMQPRHREMLHLILKMQQQQQQQQQHQPTQAGPHSPNYFNQQQLCVSPMPPNAYCVSPIMATSPNTLSVPAMPQRIPSPRELQLHTQSIMQRALIKKKLEEQEENYRKKQQQAQQRAASPAAKTSSPTPLAFMPTSVMRKLTADKEDASKDTKDAKLGHGRPLTGVRQPSASNPAASNQWVSNAGSASNHFAPKQAGRAIVKANYQAHQEFYQRLVQHQQQQKTFYNAAAQPYQQLSQQQLRQQHQNVRAQHQQHQQPASAGGGTWSFADNHHARNDLSPTSDQLARWFSPDLLERARKGNVPSIPASAMAQHALSLEEIERQTTPVGHN